MVDGRTRTGKVVRQLQGANKAPKSHSEGDNLISNDFILPNRGGDHSAGIVIKTPVKDTDIANKKYVDDNSGGASDLDDLDDVDTTTDAPVKNEVLKYNGTEWVPAEYDYNFTWSIATFTDNESSTQLIGSGVWESSGNITFDMTYNNGDPDSAYITESGGSTAWPSNLTITAPFTTQVSASDTYYPSTKDSSVTFTLNGTQGTDTDNSAVSVTFRNYIWWGDSTTGSSFTEANIEALPNNEISNDITRSMSINAGVSEYLVFAYPSSYTSLDAGTDYETDGDTDFRFGGIACAMSEAETVSITNSAGYTENYKVYASTQTNLGNGTLQTYTSGGTINYLYYGKTTKTGTFLESDIEGLANSEITNDNTQTWDSVTTGSGEYMLFAFPKRLGTVTFWIGGFEGGFESPETVSVTNSNGWTEDYYAWRSTNANLGATVVETQ